MSPAESLREKLIYFLEPGITYKAVAAERRAEAGRLVDEYTHELAEEIRQMDTDPGTRFAADAIDPYVSDAGPVRPDEEPTT